MALAIKIFHVWGNLENADKIPSHGRVHLSNTHVKCEDARRHGDMKKETGGKGWEVEGR